MKKVLSTVIVASLVAIFGGCALFDGGFADNQLEMFDFKVVAKGEPILLAAPEDTDVIIATVSVDIGDIPFISDKVNNVETYIVLGAEDYVASIPTNDVVVGTNDVVNTNSIPKGFDFQEFLGESVTVGEFYTVKRGEQVDLVAYSNSPALVIGVAIDLSEINGIPETIKGSIAPYAKPRLVFGAKRK